MKVRKNYYAPIDKEEYRYFRAKGTKKLHGDVERIKIDEGKTMEETVLLLLGEAVAARKKRK